MNKANEEKHLNHPLYTESRELFISTQHEQILKGAAKYDEPLNPSSWTPQELLTHMLQEGVDMTHYGMCLFKQLEEKDRLIEEYLTELNQVKEENAQFKEVLVRQSVKLNQYETHKLLPPL